MFTFDRGNAGFANILTHYYSIHYKSRKPCKSNLKCSFESCKVSLKASVRRLGVIHTLAE